jgi:DNA-binding GntR family transcriptional regulator
LPKGIYATAKAIVEKATGNQRVTKKIVKAAPTRRPEPSTADESARNGKSRSSYVYEKLCDAISEGRFAPGKRLGEEEIAKLFGVSRTPVREALLRLQARGLLTGGVGRSLVVAQLGMQQVLELYAMREILEGSAARFAAQHAGAADIALLRRLHKEFMAAWKQPARLVPLNRRFHQAIYEAAHNRYLTQALNEFHDAFALLHSNTFRIPNRPRETNEEHIKIIEAIAERDPDRAEQAAREHIRLAQQTRFARTPG